MNIPVWITALYACIDRKDAVGFAAFLDENVSFRFANADTVQGRIAVTDSVTQFFSAINAVRHSLEDVWEVGDTAICKGSVQYTRHDMSQLSVPFATIFKMNDGKIGEYLIYVDISTLFAPQ